MFFLCVQFCEIIGKTLFTCVNNHQQMPENCGKNTIIITMMIALQVLIIHYFLLLQLIQESLLLITSLVTRLSGVKAYSS